MQQEGAQETAGHLWLSQWQNQQDAAGIYPRRKPLKLKSVFFNFIRLLLSGSVSQNRVVVEHSFVNWEWPKVVAEP